MVFRPEPCLTSLCGRLQNRMPENRRYPHNIIRGQFMENPAGALQVHPDLINFLLAPVYSMRNRCFSNDSVSFETVFVLKSHDGRFEVIHQKIRVGNLAFKVTGDGSLLRNRGMRWSVIPGLSVGPPAPAPTPLLLGSSIFLQDRF
jgi:hypothetical protein